MDILFEDEQLLVINKPAGLSTESGKSKHPSAETEAFAYLSKQQKKSARPLYLRAVHRLDRVSSGVLVFAKGKPALSRLMAQFEARTPQKVYRTVVEHKPPSEEGRLEHFLSRNEDGKKSCVFDVPLAQTQPAVLNYRVLAKHALGYELEVLPATGRFHQIRAQMAFIGCPIAGDELYGGHFFRPFAILLHANSLRLEHPKSGKQICFEVEPEWSEYSGSTHFR